MTPRTLNLATSSLLIALIALCVIWEGWLAPIRPGGSWLTLKALPLMGAVFGVLRGRRYTHQWLSMLVLLYFTEGVLRIGDPGLMGVFAMLETAMASALFVTTVWYSRITAPSRSTDEARSS
ncbi:MAG: DUF2069 domain-containing protein [Rhodocyclaceae bacterium]